MRYFFRVEYDGTRYGGWQSQTNALSIQQTIETAFFTVTRTTCKCTGAGRTDAGVHAVGQGAHVDLDVPVVDIRKLERGVNGVLPHDIAIYNMQEVDDTFHARFSAVRRRYKYYFSQRKRPILYKRVFMLYDEIGWNIVERNLPHLLGVHDFSTFCASRSSTTNMMCNVQESSIAVYNGDRVFTITADRFLYTMVRSIVGTFIDMGRGRITMGLDEIIAAKNRKLSGETAPPCGLVLDYVEYDNIDS